jgi:hypothetical protein
MEATMSATVRPLRAVAPTPREALEHAQVDVIGMIRAGIPAREFVAGTAGAFPKGKRCHVTAEKKTGKSISIAVATAVEIVAAGGSVAVLDRENGADEYARRTDSVLVARDADDAFREQVRQRLRYYAWPALSLAWREDPDYPAALGESEVVIFDSSRQHLTPLGLDENSAGDWSQFSDGLIDPLMQAGKTTIVLDNAGHLEKDRARGTTAKEDLADLAFTMKVIAPFSLSVAGRIHLRCIASRIGELTIGDTWQMELGAGHYGSWQQLGRERPEHRSSFRPTNIMEKVSRTVEQTPGLSKTAIRGAVPHKNEHVDLALGLLVSEGFLVIEKDGQARLHRSARPYREADDQLTQSTQSEPSPNPVPDPVDGTQSTQSSPLREGPGTGLGSNGHGPANQVPLEAHAHSDGPETRH